MRRLLIAVTVGTLVLAGCTTIPISSAPQVVKSIDSNGDQNAPCPPVPADPRSVVRDFLGQNLDTHDITHACARRFLTPSGRSHWSDSTITIVDDTQISIPAGDKVTVTGKEIGRVDAFGHYSPALRGDGSGVGGTEVTRTYGMKQVNGKWRVDSLPNGLLLKVVQFDEYRQRLLYFFDSKNHLVPDPRYSQLTDPTQLADWLIARLVDGPSQGTAWQSWLPDQTDAKRVIVQFPAQNSDSEGPVKIELPGAAQLSAQNRDRLAAQVANTLEQATAVVHFEITDGGQPVRIPAANGPTFTSTNLASRYEVTFPQSQLFFVRDGGVYSDSGKRLPGKVGSGAYGLTSVALTPHGNSFDVAGVRGSAHDSVLEIGTPDELIATRVHGQLSRPAWSPSDGEAWIGDGTQLWRSTAFGAAYPVSYRDVAGNTPSGQITAVRLSPEGARAALVLTDPKTATSQVWVGPVVRGTAQVQLTGLVPITPSGVRITDVAWNDELNLFAVGTDIRTGNFGVYEVLCDGSLWTPRGTSGLPGSPESVTIAAESLAVVSIDGTLWRQTADSRQGGSWEALRPGGDSRGTNPVYVE